MVEGGKSSNKTAPYCSFASGNMAAVMPSLGWEASQYVLMITGAEEARSTFQKGEECRPGPNQGQKQKLSGNVGRGDREHLRKLRGPEAVTVNLLWRP